MFCPASLLALFCALPSAAEVKDEGQQAFAICRVVAATALEAQSFSFERSLKLKDKPDHIKGHYDPKPLLTISSVSSADSLWNEMAAAPFPGLRMAFTDAGYRTLSAIAGAQDDAEFLILIGGKAFATIEGAVLREIAGARGTLVISFPHGSGELNEKLAKLINDARQKLPQ